MITRKEIAVCRTDLIYSAWAADETPFEERITKTLEALQAASNYELGYFEVLSWTVKQAGNQTPSVVTIQIEEINRRLLVELWQATAINSPTTKSAPLKQSASSNLIAKGILNSTRIFSRVSNTSFNFDYFPDYYNEDEIYFCEYDISIDISRNFDELPKEMIEGYLEVFRRLGTCPAMSGFWLLNHSAFAGDPICLYEPPTLFKRYYDVLRYEDVLKQVRAVRHAVRAAFTTNEIAVMLTELGAQVEPIGQDRLFVQFGELGSDDGERILQQLEPQITARLSRA